MQQPFDHIGRLFKKKRSSEDFLCAKEHDGFFAYPPETSTPFRGDMQKKTYHFVEQFDFISASASLHHMPFDQALEKMVSLLRPGDVLAMLGCFREAGLTDIGIALVAVPVNTFYALSRGSVKSGAPTKPADMSLREIREHVSSYLPDACLHRLLLWRYLLTWQKPQEQTRFPKY